MKNNNIPFTAYGTKEELEARKVEYNNNLNRAKKTVWGSPIIETTINAPIYEKFSLSGSADDKKKVLKVGNLYFYTKNETTPDIRYTTEEIIEFLLEGDIGSVIDKSFVKNEIQSPSSGDEMPQDYITILIADIKLPPHENDGLWGVQFKCVGSNTQGTIATKEVVNPFVLT